jgi:hypothetical protein
MMAAVTARALRIGRIVGEVSGGVLARFRLAYCLVLIPITVGQLAFAHVQYARPPATYVPIHLFRWLHIGLPPEWITWVLALLLVIALTLAALGIRTRGMLLLSVLLFLGFFGTTTGWRWKYVGSSEYAFEHALHPTLLLLLASAPDIGPRFRLLPRPHFDAASPPRAVPAWPLTAIELALGLSYWGAFYTKLADSGLSWADGYNLQTYLLEKYSFTPTLHAGLWLAQHRGLCQILSIGNLLLEGLFVSVILVPRRSRLRWVYVAAGLSFHLLTWLTMGISVFALSYCAAYLVFLDAFWPREGLVPTAPTSPAPLGWYGLAITGATVLVLLGCILGRFNRWPLCDWSAFSEHSDWRSRADITRCELHLPRGQVAGCAAVSLALAKRVQVPIAEGETAEEAVRTYLTALPMRRPGPPTGSELHLQVREYVTDEGLLQPRFRPLVFVF